METEGSVEILVHVAAPCRAVDDVRYRALAQAYIDFHPKSQTKILSRITQSNVNDIIPSSQPESAGSQTYCLEPVPSSEATQLPTSPPGPFHSTELSFKSVELSFRSVLDNINSPGLGRAIRDVICAAQDFIPSSQPETQTQLSQGSWIAPPSVVGDSQPFHDISIAEFSSPSRLFEHLACQFDAQDDDISQQTPSRSQPRVSEHPSQAEERQEENGSEENGSEENGSEENGSEENGSEDEEDDQAVLVTSRDPLPARDEIPPGPASTEKIVLSTPFPAFKKPLPKSSPLEQVIQDTPCQTHRKRPSTSSPSRAGSEPPPSSKRHKRSAPISESRSITRSTSDVGGTSTSDLYKPIRPPNERHLSYLERLEIHPAGPPVASTELGPNDLLTPKLRELALQLNISKRFHPVEQRRELRPFERGHWLLDWTGWRPTLRERAWHFLTDYILEGFAGWGVWCKRAEDWSWLRVYCWGHVVGHIYLALYLASERALKTDAARWVDGAGEVIVVTNGHDNSESGESMEEGSERG